MAIPPRQARHGLAIRHCCHDLAAVLFRVCAEGQFPVEGRGRCGCCPSSTDTRWSDRLPLWGRGRLPLLLLLLRWLLLRWLRLGQAHRLRLALLPGAWGHLQCRCDWRYDGRGHWSGAWRLLLWSGLRPGRLVLLLQLLLRLLLLRGRLLWWWRLHVGQVCGQAGAPGWGRT